MATSKNILKNWFVNGAKPNQNQFYAWFDSYWHKDESIPIGKITGIATLLEAKADISQLDNKANRDGTNITDADAEKWRTALGLEGWTNPDLANYYTRDEVDGLLATVTVDLSNYHTIAEYQDWVMTKGYITSAELSAAVNTRYAITTSAIEAPNATCPYVILTSSAGVTRIMNLARWLDSMDYVNSAQLAGKLDKPSANPSATSMAVINPDGSTATRSIPTVYLVALSTSAPSTSAYAAGDKYYNLTDKNIYTKVGATWKNPIEPELYVQYIDTANNINYYWNGIVMIAINAVTSDIKRNFTISVSQTTNVVQIPFNQKVNSLNLQTVMNVASFSDFILYKGNTAGTTRTTLAQIQTDINALTIAEANAGYTVQFKINLTGGETYATAILTSNAS